LSAKYENFRISWKWCLENIMNPISIQGIFRKFPHFYIFKENGKNRSGVGGIVGYHVTSGQGKPLDVAVSAGVATKR
jgi:hypothetical protein